MKVLRKKKEEIVLTPDTKFVKCVVCDEEILDNGLPICVDCINAEKTIVYCRHCQSHFQLQDDNEADNLWWSFLVSLPDFPGYDKKGTTIKVSHCPECTKKFGLGKETLKIYFFHIRKKD